jgi:hypothetical protein
MTREAYFSLSTPTDFILSIELDGISVQYLNVMEICQGGPQVGTLCINNKHIAEVKFGGPFIIANNVIYVPMQWKNGWGSIGFKLAIIDIIDIKVYTTHDKVTPLIFLDSVEENEIFYYSDTEKTHLHSYNLSQLIELTN